MQIKLKISLKCNFCGNTDDNQFYFMPVEEKTLDGAYFSLMKYNVVCKKCKVKKIIEVNINIK